MSKIKLWGREDDFYVLDPPIVGGGRSEWTDLNE